MADAFISTLVSVMTAEGASLPSAEEMKTYSTALKGISNHYRPPFETAKQIEKRFFDTKTLNRLPDFCRQATKTGVKLNPYWTTTVFIHLGILSVAEASKIHDLITKAIIGDPQSYGRDPDDNSGGYGRTVVYGAFFDALAEQLNNPQQLKPANAENEESYHIRCLNASLSTPFLVSFSNFLVSKKADSKIAELNKKLTELTATTSKVESWQNKKRTASAETSDNSPAPKKSKKNAGSKFCRFYISGRSCKFGADCSFRHVVTRAECENYTKNGGSVPSHTLEGAVETLPNA